MENVQSSALPVTPQPFGLELSALSSYIGKPGSLPGVTFWPRAAAKLIDFVVHYVVSFCGGVLFGILFRLAIRSTHASLSMVRLRPGQGVIALFFFALLGSIAFEVVCEAIDGSTPGKRLLSIVVVQEDGTPCRFRSALIRSFAYLIDSLFFGVIGYFNMQKTPQNQRHGDEWAETVVCRRSDVAPENLRGLDTFLVALCLASMADAAFVMIGLLMRFYP
jgi:uncharacterized RDD family membrane protein YckC